MDHNTGRSPLAPVRLLSPPPLAGVELAVAQTNTRYQGRPDILLAKLDAGASLAGVFTTSKTASAPVDWCRRHIGSGSVRAIVVNAGNANAFTGQRGLDGVREIAEQTAQITACEPEEVFIASTGVIGEFLDTATITAHLDDLNRRLAPTGWIDAANAIMTTDTYPKLASEQIKIGDCPITINGIAKGSGMIAPDMATMLSFIFTDATIAPDILQQLLQRSSDRSFNAITVDGDTSTSDTVLLCATGAAPGAPVDISSLDDPRLSEFSRGLDKVCLDLAHQIVRDGEGAEKFVSITVSGAEDDRAARKIGLTIGNSPLVKTAIAGEDANWGRIVMAIGKSGEQADRDRLLIKIGGITVAENGLMAAGYDEADLIPHMRSREITIEADVGIGTGRATVWTCDLTHRYIDINADYRS